MTPSNLAKLLEAIGNHLTIALLPNNQFSDLGLSLHSLYCPL